MNESTAAEAESAAPGYQGPAAHTWTVTCAGHHPVSEPCEAPEPGRLAAKFVRERDQALKELGDLRALIDAGQPSLASEVTKLRGQLEAARATIGEQAVQLVQACDDRDDYAARLKAADQSWAKVAAERDAHKLRADHYEARWRAEHGLPPGEPGGTGAEAAVTAEEEAQAAAILELHADRDHYQDLASKYVDATIKRGEALSEIRRITPLGRHATPDECAAIARIARAALAAVPPGGGPAPGDVDMAGTGPWPQLTRAIWSTVTGAFRSGVIAGVRVERDAPGTRPHHAASGDVASLPADVRNDIRALVGKVAAYAGEAVVPPGGTGAEAAAGRVRLAVNVNGQAAEVHADPGLTLHSVIPGALAQTGYAGWATDNWELRSAQGTLLDLARRVSDYRFEDGTQLYLSPRAGIGG